MPGRSISSKKREVSSMSCGPEVIDPLPDDVLLGRGSSHAWRPGNARFHELLDRFVNQYHETSNHEVRTGIIQFVYDNVRRHGRFLVKIPNSEHYMEIDESDAKKRTGQAMRYRRRRLDNEPKEPNDSRSETFNHELRLSSATTWTNGHVASQSQGQRSPVVAQTASLATTLDEAAAHNHHRTALQEDLFSDEDLASVLGDPSEYTSSSSLGGPV